MTTPQYVPTPGQQWGQQFAAQPQTTQAPPAAVTATLNDPSNWTISAASDAGGSPVKAIHLLGRNIIVVPLSAGTSPNPQNPSKPSKFIKCDVFVLDGPAPFYFGGSPNGKPVPIPDTMCVQSLPYLAAGTILFGEVLHDQLEASIGKGIMVGKMATKRTNSGNTPYVISPDDVTPEQLALTGQLIQAHYRDRTFVNPEVIMIAGPQAQPQFAQQAPPQPAYYAPQPSWPQAQPGMVGQPMAGPTPPAQPAQAAPAQAFNFGALAAPAAPAPVEDWTLNTMPPGTPPEALGQWQAMPQEQRLQYLAAANITRPTGL